jgi:hypothetical protein
MAQRPVLMGRRILASDYTLNDRLRVRRLFGGSRRCQEPTREQRGGREAARMERRVSILVNLARQVVTNFEKKLPERLCCGD